jgi:hypothetical protein
LVSFLDVEGIPGWRILRLGLGGEPLSLYRQVETPKPRGFFDQLLGGRGPSIQNPMAPSGCVRFVPGRDGSTFALIEERTTLAVTLRGQSPEGSMTWTQPVHLDAADLIMTRVFAERDGGALLLVPGAPALLRVTPAGAWALLSPERTRALVHKSMTLAPTPDGDILLFGERGDIVRLAPDGREVWCNEAAKAVERERAIAAQRN